MLNFSLFYLRIIDNPQFTTLMSKRTLRKLPRIDYAVLHDSGERTPYSQIRESPQESDGSSEESLSGNDNSQDRTLIRDEVESRGVICSLRELKTLVGC